MIKIYRTAFISLLVLVALLKLVVFLFVDSLQPTLAWTAIYITLFLLYLAIVIALALKLKRNENHLQTLLDSLDEALVICDEKGEITYSNGLAKELLTMDVNLFPSVFSDVWDEGIRLETLSGIKIQTKQRPLVRALRGESVDREEFRLRSLKSHVDKIVAITGKPVHGALGEVVGAMLIMKDITALREEEHHRIRLTEILEKTSDYVGIANVNGSVVYINEGGFKIIGRQPIADVHLSRFHPDWVNEVIANEGIPTAISKGIWSGETALINQFGETIPVSQVILSHKSESGEVEFLSTIARDISHIKEAERKVIHMAMHDELTGLLNRRGFSELAVRCLAKLKIAQQPAAFFYCDLNGFKQVNDLYGHQAGDSLIQQVAQRVTTIIRGNDLASRQGGDEFALLLAGLPVEEAARKAESLHALFVSPFMVDGHEVDVCMSIGVGMFPTDGDTIEALMKRADHAMYVSKSTGKNSTSFYHDNSA